MFFGRPAQPEVNTPFVLALCGTLTRVKEGKLNSWIDLETRSTHLAVLVDWGNADAPVVALNNCASIDGDGVDWILDCFHQSPLYQTWKKAIHAPVLRPITTDEFVELDESYILNGISDDDDEPDEE